MRKYLFWVVVFILGFAVAALAAWDGATNYPAALDDAASMYDVEDAGTVEDEHHDALAQAVIAIETLIGISPTDHALVVGSGAGPITKLAVGAAGEILVGVAGGDPKWLVAGTAGYMMVANGANDPVWTANTGTGAPVRGTAPQISTIELGHATDTTIARSAAGALAILQAAAAHSRPSIADSGKIR